MKKNVFIITAILFSSCLISLSSCEDYFEKPFGVNFNEDSVFTRYESALKLVNDMYVYRPYYMHLYVSNSSSASRLQGSLLDAATDLGGSLKLNSNYGGHKFNQGNVLAEFISNDTRGEDVYGNHYKTIRKAFTLLERIDEVPDAPSGQKERIKAEAQTMIAFEYFRLMKRYGGVPLLKKRLDPQNDELAIERAPLIDVYNYIMEMLDLAIVNPNFAARYDGQEFGRLNKAFAYGLKAKAALYIASPLFNSAQPYMDLGANNNLICLMSYDPKRWETAFKFTEAAINFCEANGYAIVNTPNKDLNYTISYQYRPNAGNTEVMWATMDLSNPSMAYWTPRGGGDFNNGGYTANMPTLNLVEKYQNKDGLYIDWDTPITTLPKDPTSPYENLDPRFGQTVMYNGMEVYPNAFFENYNYNAPASHPLDGENGPRASGMQFAHLLRKHVYGYEDRLITQKTWQPMCPIMRLTELYLMYSEALNETLSAPDNRVLEKINIIRDRSGMPGIPAGLSKNEMRKRIQDEWAIEFAFEEYRFFDLKRWKMGQEFIGPIYDLHVIKNADESYTYTKYLFEERVFFDWYYLHPLPPSEINMQYGLIQNPGW
ncbi:MAG: RagB/SusD family nutrient uptake outer membrane protein [Fulvivirga sp.]